MDQIKSRRSDVERAIRDKGVGVDLDALLALEAEVRRAKTEIESARAANNAISSSFQSASAEERPILAAKAKEASARAREQVVELAAKDHDLKAMMLRLPGIPWEGAPVGPNEDSNVVIRTEGKRPRFDFDPIDHVALIEKNDWAELSRIVKVSGSRTYCLKGRLALLETKLMAWALEQVMSDGFVPITVPSIANYAAFEGTGHFPGHEAEAYHIAEDALYLAGTGEIALTSLHSGEILERDKLPMLYAGLSPCFRREAGSAGRDVRGLLRVHQFLKVEAYVICENDEALSAQWHAKLLAIAERLLTMLEIPYQVVETSTGDMGLGKYRMNDIESWVPSLEKYRETHSCSTLHEWQARRANLRYRDAEGKMRFAHTLNNTALASPRILVPLIENHQLEDGRVRLPEAIRPLMGGDEFL